MTLTVTGFLFDVTGNYQLAFCTAGVAIASAGIICLPLRYLQKCNTAQRSLDAVEKTRAMRAEERQHDTRAVKSAPALRTNTLIGDAKLFTSTTLLTGSHGFIGLPNPYIRHTDTPCDVIDDTRASTDQIHIRTQTLNKLTSKLSQSESVLNKSYKQRDPI